MAKDQASSQTQPVEERAAQNVGRQVSTSQAGSAAGTTGTSGNTQVDFETLTNQAQHAGRQASVSGNRITLRGSDKITGYEVTLEPAPAQGGYRVVEVKGPDGKETQRVSIFERDGVIPLDTITAELKREETDNRNRKEAERQQQEAQQRAADEERLRRETSATQPSSSEASTPNPPPGETHSKR